MSLVRKNDCRRPDETQIPPLPARDGVAVPPVAPDRLHGGARFPTRILQFLAGGLVLKTAMVFLNIRIFELDLWALSTARASAAEAELGVGNAASGSHARQPLFSLRIASNWDAFDLLRSVNTLERVVYRVSPAPENLWSSPSFNDVREPSTFTMAPEPWIRDPSDMDMTCPARSSSRPPSLKSTTFPFSSLAVSVASIPLPLRRTTCPSSKRRVPLLGLIMRPSGYTHVPSLSCFMVVNGCGWPSRTNRIFPACDVRWSSTGTTLPSGLVRRPSRLRT